jgi:DNA primase catalytic core
VESAGVELKRKGRDWHGCCPFHDDRTPSLVVSEDKNLWHCLGACQTGGSVIDWVMKAQGVSFRHAVELLKDDPSLAARATPGIKTTTVRKLAPPVSLDGEVTLLLNQCAGYYRDTLKQSPEALAYLKARGLDHPEIIERFQLGFANRTLGLRLPEKNRKSGAELRTALQSVGILRDSGHEHFNGCLVIPVHDEHGNVAEMYGRKITGDTKLRAGTPLHLYLPGPHRGVWNLDALKASKEIILCESLIDALTFWCAGYRHVTAAYGVEGFTDELLEAFRRYQTQRVLIAFDRDEAGERGAQKVAAQLMGLGIECFRIEFPKGMDANEYARKVQPAAKSLGLVIRKAAWMGKGQPKSAVATVQADPVQATSEPARPVVNDPAPSSTVHPDPVFPLAADAVSALPGATVHAEEAPARSCDASHPASLQAGADSCPPVAAVPRPMTGRSAGRSGASPDSASPAPALPEPPAAVLPASPLPAAAASEATQREGEVRLSFGERQWRVRGLPKNLAYEVLKVNLHVRSGEAFHVDTLDLYHARARASFITQAAMELRVPEETVKADLGRVLLKLETLQDETIQQALAPAAPVAAAMLDAEREAALSLLKRPNLVDCLLADFDACGLIGERSNKLIAYLAAVSRKLDRPLAVLVQSTSAAGKSSLMDAVLAFMPEEERIKYSAMTGQSLFYMGETNLKHKILAIAEEEGASRAAYALKLLQSEGELTMASTGKDPATGNLITQEYRVEGPVMIFLTTTARDLDEELLNRCLVLSVDEGREQTRAIHRLQREKRTLDGLIAKQRRQALVSLHQNAQRLLRALDVLNPYARFLSFPDQTTRLRRDHEKYLTLIDAIAFLHQHQRPVKTHARDGQRVEYVEVTLDDIRLANELAHEVLGRSLDELPPQTRRLLRLIDGHVVEACARLSMRRADFHFSRRSLREAIGWGDTQLKVHLARLMELEYLIAHRTRTGGFDYELVYDTAGDDERLRFPGLADLDQLARDYDGARSGSDDGRSGSGRPAVGPRSAGGRGEENAGDADGTRLAAERSAGAPETQCSGEPARMLSYPQAAVPC